jgi:site-specific recombinase
MIAEGSPVLALMTKRDDKVRLDELCEFAPREGAEEQLVLWFVRLVAWIRPRDGQRVGGRLRFFAAQMAHQPEWRDNVSATLGNMLERVDMARLLAYGGIPLDFHFGGAVKEWLLERALPSACKTEDGAQIMRLAFVLPDLEWLGDRDTVAFFRGLCPTSRIAPLDDALREALVDLSHQIVAQAQSPGIRRLARADRSPYRGLFEAAATFNSAPEDPSAFNALRGRVRQCALLLQSHRSELAYRGADLNTTFQLTRMQEQLDRVDLLARLRHDASTESLRDTAVAIVGDVVRSGSGKRLLTRSADLVVQNIVDSAASVGRAYLDDAQSSWGAAFRAGAGGGALMVLATVLKFLLASLRLPALYEGLAFSVNYAGVFCAAYLLHFTIATKLPAHTAAALARSSQSGPGHRARLTAFVSVWRTALRLQLAGLLGNVAVAAPLAVLLDECESRAFGSHFLSAEKAEHVLSSTSVLGPSVVYAALTGLLLWISSLVGAWGDNWARVNRLSDRLATNRHVMTRVSAARARRFADVVAERVGGLLGNASLGFLLGGIPAAFAIAHLPVEIRHITVSTSSVALAFARGAGTRSEAALAVLGLLVIAVVNVVVSFVLALWLALRATQGMRASVSSHALVRIGFRTWAARLLFG